MNFALVLTFAFAFADWFAVARANKTLEYVFKPATMFGIIALTLVLMQSPHDAWQARWFLAGFCLSLLGDVFLLFAGTRPFLLGLGAFLLAHLAYILGLNPTLPPPNAFVLLIPCIVVVSAVVWRVVAGLRAKNRSALVGPVILYGVAMTLMVFSAWATLFRADWNDARRAFVIAGATLFFVSDAMLAWNRFVQEFSAAKLGIIVTYHLGQIALALSIAL